LPCLLLEQPASDRIQGYTGEGRGGGEWRTIPSFSSRSGRNTLSFRLIAVVTRESMWKRLFLHLFAPCSAIGPPPPPQRGRSSGGPSLAGRLAGGPTVRERDVCRGKCEECARCPARPPSPAPLFFFFFFSLLSFLQPLLLEWI